MKLLSMTEEETKNIGVMLGAEARKGDIICLSGDLSAGKTHLTKGIAIGLQIEEEIISPTFSIVNSYDNGRLKLHHFDVYRLEDPSEIENIGYEDYFFGDGVCVIEWPEMIKDYIPKDAIWVNLSKNLEKGENARNIEIEEE